MNRRLAVLLAISVAAALGLVMARAVSEPAGPVVPVIQLDRGEVPPAPSLDLPPPAEIPAPEAPPPAPTAPAAPAADDDDDDGPDGDDDEVDDDDDED